jgi:hypothetical protein
MAIGIVGDAGVRYVCCPFYVEHMWYVIFVIN